MLQGSGWNRLIHRNCLTIETNSIKLQDLLVKKYNIPIPEKDWKRIDVRYFTLELEPLGKEKIRLRSVMNFDPNCWFLPGAFYKFVSKTCADFLF